jgi:diaminopimelate decarboxylase
VSASTGEDLVLPGVPMPAVPLPTESATAPIERRLLPMTAAVDQRDRLSIGGVDLIDAAEEFGTPLFVYDEVHLRARCREAVEAWGDGVAYATKAFLCRAMARLADDEGMSLDVSTAGELHVALAAGVSPERLVLHGNNKSDDELATAMAAGVGRIIVDSFDEIDRIERLCIASDGSGPPVPPKVLVRITPGVEVHTHEFVQTGQDDSKFGFGLGSGAADRALARLDDLSRRRVVDLVGVHAHLGSQVFALGPFAQAVDLLAGFFATLDLPELVVGGGLGVPYVATEEAPSMAEWAAVVRRACADAGIPKAVRVTAEPGRSIVAAAAVTLYRVGTVKHVSGHRTYVAVDGGMSDNPRPVLYGSGYEAFFPRATGAERPMPVRVVGKHCETGDLLIPDGFVPKDLVVGDILATPVTGAYGHSMASNYNKVPRPAVVFVADGRARVVVRRETLDDLLHLDA